MNNEIKTERTYGLQIRWGVYIKITMACQDDGNGGKKIYKYIYIHEFFFFT